jgi:uroporphyrinogen-III synthase
MRNCQLPCVAVRLLVTRPEADGARTAAALSARGHTVMVAPLLHIAPVPFALPRQQFAAVVLTSANATHALSAHPARDTLTALPAFTVGRHTAAAARAAGFRDVTSADGDKEDLAALLRAREPKHALLYLAGEDRAGDAADWGVPVLTVVAYRAVKVERFSPPVAAALAQNALDGVLHFSRRSAQAYVDCAAREGGPALAPVHFCLSRQVAQPLRAAGAATIRIAPRPDEAALLELVGPA